MPGLSVSNSSLTFAAENAEGLRKLVDVSGKAIAAMDALFDQEDAGRAAAKAPRSGRPEGTDLNTIPPPDENAHLDGLLMAEVTSVNTLLGRYVLRFLDADAGWAEPISIEDERALAERLSAAADGVRARVARRAPHRDQPPLIEQGR